MRRGRTVRKHGWTALLGALLSVVAAAWPSRAAMPSATQETGVWRLKCGNEKDVACQLVQYASLRLGEPPLFLVTITRDEKSGKRFGIVTTPLRVYLAPGIRIAVDRKRPFKAAFELCDERGCHAGFRFDGALASAFRKGERADVTVWTAKDKAVVIPVSLEGFSTALQKLESGERP